MPAVNRPHNNCIHKEESDPTQFPSESRLARPIAGRNNQQECPCRHGRVGSKNVHVAMAVWAPSCPHQQECPCRHGRVGSKNVHVAMAVWAPSCPHQQECPCRHGRVGSKLSTSNLCAIRRWSFSTYVYLPTFLFM